MSKRYTFKELYDKYIGNRPTSILKIIMDESDRITVKDNETINWWASNLNGVYKISYSKSEINTLFYKLGIDILNFKEDIINTDGFNKDWEVSRDPFNVLMSMCYIKVNELSKHKQEDMLFKVFRLLYFKMIVGRTNHYFSNYKQDEEIARFAYDNYSMKYDLKKLGSQYKVMEKKFEMFKVGSKQHKTILMSLNKGGELVVKFINYLFSSINDYIKKSLNAIIEAENKYNENRGVYTNLDTEGENVGRVSKEEQYISNIKSVVMDDNAYYNNNLIKLMHITFRDFNTNRVLELISKLNKDIKDTDDVDRLLESIVYASYNYLTKEEVYPPFNKVLPKTLVILRRYWSASKSSNEHIKNAKQMLRPYIENIGIRRTSTVSNLTITTCIYLFLLTVIETDVKR